MGERKREREMVGGHLSLLCVTTYPQLKVVAAEKIDCIYVCICECVCVRERERERKREVIITA